jgi:hypothetical protein
MSFSSMKNLFGRYSPISDGAFTDSEKDAQRPLGKEVGDLEMSPSGSSADLGYGGARAEKKRFTIDARVVSDAIIGLSDGLTVPFALTAGLSTLDDTKVVVFGGLAELIAGAISMGLGGYLGAKSEE